MHMTSVSQGKRVILHSRFLIKQEKYHTTVAWDDDGVRLLFTEEVFSGFTKYGVSRFLV